MHLHVYCQTSSVSLFFIFYHRHVNVWLNSHSRSHSNGFVLWNWHSTNANFSWLRHIPSIQASRISNGKFSSRLPWITCKLHENAVTVCAKLFTDQSSDKLQLSKCSEWQHKHTHAYIKQLWILKNPWKTHKVCGQFTNYVFSEGRKE